MYLRIWYENQLKVSCAVSHRIQVSDADSVPEQLFPPVCHSVWSRMLTCNLGCFCFVLFCSGHHA